MKNKQFCSTNFAQIFVIGLSIKTQKYQKNFFIRKNFNLKSFTAFALKN